MTTLTASGLSNESDTATAAREALSQARSQFNGHSPGFGFLFAGPDHDLSTALAEAQAGAEGTDFVGCTTAGEFTEEGLIHDGISVMLVAADDTSHRTFFANGMRESPEGVAGALCDGFSADKERASQRDQLRSTTVLLTDGLSGTGEQALEAIKRQVGPFQQIAGGAAGDEGRFETTTVGAGNNASADAAAAVHIFSRDPWGIGVGHGLQPASEPMLVTAAEGNVVREIDGNPAFDAYRRHAQQRGVELSEDNAGSYLIGNELGVFTFDRVSKARAPLSVGDDGSLTCAAEIPTGASICILDGDPESMVEAAREAALEAKEHLEGRSAAGVLLFDCVCRGMILRDRFQEEIDAVRSVFGPVPVAGFLTYGEIARYRGKLGGWHNTTAVVLAIPAN